VGDGFDPSYLFILTEESVIKNFNSIGDGFDPSYLFILTEEYVMKKTSTVWGMDSILHAYLY
jgi:hypothetical protein